MDYCVASQTDKAEFKLSTGELTHAEIADTLLYLREQGYSPNSLQKITGFKDYTIRHYLRISKKLSPPVKDLLHRDRIKFSLARTLASLPIEKQEAEAKKAIMTGISVHRFRDKLSGDEKFCDKETEQYFERLAMVIAEKTGFNLSITPDKNNKHAGNISLRYTDLRDFDSICSRMQVDLSDL
jgi:hypothetical protein